MDPKRLSSTNCEIGKNMGDNTDPATCKGHGYSPMCCSDRIDVRSPMLMLSFPVFVFHTNMLLRL